MNFKLFSGRLDIELTRRDGLRLWVRNADFDGSEFHMQIARPHSAIAGCVTVGSMSGDVSGHVALWPVGLYWHATHPTLRDAARVLVDDYKGREVSLRIGGSDCVDRVMAHWRVWSPPHEWTRGTPRWRDGSWYPLATLFGPTTYREAIDRRDDPVTIAMPEGTYTATVEHTIRTWTRPRWPDNWERVATTNIKVEGGIPIPGKGENAWDLDDDAVIERSFHDVSSGEAIMRFVLGIHETRILRGGPDWTPTRKTQEASA